MGYQISKQSFSQAHAKLHLCVAMIFPDPLNLPECSVYHVFFPLLVCLALNFNDIVL